jgi:hypothetical protein
MSKPANSNGFKILTSVIFDLVTNAPNNANATRHADPIANPFPIAAVVFPAASSISVNYLASANSHISAIPPALSEIGPYPSMVRAVLRVDSIPNAAREIPYILAKMNEK